jgi:hypothetical protein
VKPRARVESLMLEDVEPAMVRPSSDERSNKNLVEEGTIVITRGWSQRWHRGTVIDAERERIRKLGLRGDV